MPAPAKSRMALWLGVAAVVALVAAFIWLRKNRRAAILRLPPSNKRAKPCARVDADRTTLSAGDLAGRTADVVRQFIAANFGIAARTHHGGIFQMVIHSQDSPLQVHTDMLRTFLKSCAWQNSPELISMG